MKTIGLVIDSSGNYNKQLADELGLGYIPIPITIDQVEYLDGIDLDYLTLLKKASTTKKAMKTSQGSLGLALLVWEEMLKQYDYVIHLTLSSKLSKMYENFSHNAIDRVFVVDSLNVVGGYTYEVQVALALIASGLSVLEIVDILQKRAGLTRGIVLPKNLEHLRRGGRISATSATFGNLLGILPLIGFKNGCLEKYGKARTFKKAISNMIVYVEQELSASDFVILHHTNNFEQLALLKSALLAKFPNLLIYEAQVTGAILCHTGPGVIAVLIVKKYQQLEYVIPLGTYV